MTLVSSQKTTLSLNGRVSLAQKQRLCQKSSAINKCTVCDFTQASYCHRLIAFVAHSYPQVSQYCHRYIHHQRHDSP